MTKAIIRNEQPFRGRHKGDTDGRVSNKKIQKNWEDMKWDSPQLCEDCFKKPCACGSYKEGGEPVDQP